MEIPKKVAAIHDIAGFGRSSLTVVIPTMSIMGHQTCPVPTAVLSTITGFYEGYELHDLTDILPSYLNHWEKENFKFDCIYSGFLGSKAQAYITEQFIDKAKAPLVVVDPVFADDGELYACFKEDIVGAMLSLIKKAHIITPNITEAGFLLGEPNKKHDINTAKEFAKKLSDLGPESVIITGVPLSKTSVSIIIYKKSEDLYLKIDNPYVHAHYPGTGDLFTSVLTGSLLKGVSLPESAAKAADFVFMSIKTAYESNVPVREGVPLEMLLPRLLQKHMLKIEII